MLDIAYDLAPFQRWNVHLSELADCKVKHEQKISFVNFYIGKIGNPEAPTKIRLSRQNPKREGNER
jgi:hypothetical protein